jgi:hypothetical protein
MVFLNYARKNTFWRKNKKKNREVTMPCRGVTFSLLGLSLLLS